MDTICFDLDGTLADCRRRHFTVYADVCEDLRVKPATDRRYWTLRRRGASTAEIVGDVSDGMRERFLDQWIERIEAPRYLMLDALFPGVDELLARLGERYRLVLVTLRRHRENLDQQIGALGLNQVFDEVQCGDEQASISKQDLIKPSPNASRLFVVGDSEADIALANAVSAPSICVENGIRNRAFLTNAGADHVIATVRRLPDVLNSLT